MSTVHRLWPNPPRTDLTDADLETLYGYPDGLDRPWVQANFVSSADGAVTVDDVSEGLSHPADKRIFLLGRDLCDVVLVGGGTVRAENYRGARANGERAKRRARHGLAPVPPIAVVTGGANLDPAAPLFTDTRVPPILFVSERAPSDKTAALARAGADIVVAGDQAVDVRQVLAELGRRGLLRVDCEGGPTLFGDLIAHDLVDQLCLTVAPLLAGSGAGRIVAGLPSDAPRRMDLASILLEDGFTLHRYRRIRD
ncbi:Pyrimidine reductase, riboflavin biosynthesis [Amycolatopsis xylanica]|uniref:Pyrimidine reductase, riboflavin biosynthesis n=1 Tax=Amycolatopsis xylanica TaxID=589385 RepID=A0A1H3J4J6_9PSEU|nr:pyrimidine reductase family protein [Amycolatopsis xylanica]SDY34114.1 Pyrimidine reductase, riboflavin biosynthesis [Amycolatopsis xylanica]